MELSDRQLLTNWRTRRDAHAFQAIVKRHAAMVFHTALRILNNPADAEDTTQQCFEKLVTTRETSHIESLGAWLHGMSTKLSLMHIRTSSRRSQREEHYAEISNTVDGTPEWQEIYPIIDEAIQSLDEQYRIPIIAHFLEGQSHAEIAKEIDTSRSTITTRINQGILQIEATLKKKNILSAVALAPLLTGQLTHAAAVETSLLTSLGKFALAQGHGVPTIAQGAITKTTTGALAKWGTAAVLVTTAVIGV
ncbi:MAG TPA: sigma-70 family RNA polymerase sigma factor [Candidatus Hydrogenedentes bacterium]|nr:sigma-70 family RNA polymerase sigma factor [Candidatus Hydrogenedentota bacterium]